MTFLQELVSFGESFRTHAKAWQAKERWGRHVEKQNRTSSQKRRKQASGASTAERSSSKERVRAAAEEQEKVSSADTTMGSESDASTADPGSSTSSVNTALNWMPFISCGPYGSEAMAKQVQERIPAERACRSAEATPRHRDLQLDVGSQTLRGKKPWAPAESGQDVHMVLPLDDDKLVVGVFDGHGPHGSRAANFARQHFTQAFASLSQTGVTEDEEALRDMFESAQVAMTCRRWTRTSGTTATVAIIDQKRRTMTCAHVGDSTLAIADEGGNIIFSTTDHSFNLEDEYQRAKILGSHVLESKTVSGNTIRRVCGLSVSRTLGDLDAHACGATSEPEVRRDLPLTSGSIVIVASDGLWHEVSPEEAIKLASSPACSKTASRALLAEAYPRWLEQGSYVDDITAVVVRMK